MRDVTDSGGNSIYYVHRDALSTVTAETDASGALASEYRYTPFGQQSSGSTVASGRAASEDRGFIGERSDPENGLIYLHARWYDPELGKFLTPDWWDPVDATSAAKGAPSGVRCNPVGTNRYAYAGNDPINKSDSNGHWTPGGDYSGWHEFTTLGGLMTVDQAEELYTEKLPKEYIETVTPGLRAGTLASEAFKRGDYWRGTGLSAVAAGEIVLTFAPSARLGVMGERAFAKEVEVVAADEVLTKNVEMRVHELHNVLDPIAASRRTTAVLDTTQGTRILAAGGRDLSPSQRALLESGEVAAKLPGAHAEITALEHAGRNGLVPSELAVSIPICPACRAAIEQSGGQLTGPQTAVWP